MTFHRFSLIIVFPDNHAKKKISGNLHFLLFLKLISVLMKKMHVLSTNNIKLRAKNKQDK